MGNPWDVKATEWIGKAIPNEMSKLNSYSKYIQMIPYIGQAASIIMKAGAAADAGATAYADSYKKGEGRGVGSQRAVSGVMGGVQCRASDPGIYGSDGRANRDWANVVGQIGNFLPGVSKGSSGGYKMDTSMYGPGTIAEIYNNPYLNKKADKSFAQIEAEKEAGTAPALGGGGIEGLQKLSSIMASVSLLEQFMDDKKNSKDKDDIKKNRKVLEDLLESKLQKYVFNDMRKNQELSLQPMNMGV